MRVLRGLGRLRRSYGRTRQLYPHRLHPPCNDTLRIRVGDNLRCLACRVTAAVDGAPRRRSSAYDLAQLRQKRLLRVYPNYRNFLRITSPFRQFSQAIGARFRGTGRGRFNPVRTAVQLWRQKHLGLLDSDLGLSYSTRG